MTTEYLENNSLYLNDLTGAETPFPIAVNIELTTFCNLRCIMCPKTAGISRTPGNQTIPDEILDRILDEVVPHVFRIDLVGDGEILLETSKLFKILEVAKRHSVLVNASTNAVLLTREVSEQLIKYQLHDLNVSLDAATSSTYKKVRGADLETVLKNIDTLNRVKKEHQSSLPNLQFSLVGMKQNIHELPQLVELAAKHHARAVMVQAMGEFKGVKNESVYLRDKALGRKWLNKAREIAEKHQIAVNLWPEDQFSESTEPEQSNTELNKNRLKLKDCSFPWEIPYFDTQGAVRPCCAVQPLGSLKENAFCDIWNGDSFRNLRRELKSVNPPAECKVCPGRGWYSPEKCESILLPGKHDRQFGTGWFETETYKGEQYRWAREEASFFISGQGPAILETEIHTVWDIGTTQKFTIQIDHEKEHHFQFDYGQRKKVYVPLNNTNSLHRVVIRGKGWRPVETVEGEQDPRSLSVMFYGARLLAVNNVIEFVDETRLWFHRAICHEDQYHLSLFWEFNKELDPPVKMFVHLLPDLVPIFPGIGFRAYEFLRKFAGLGRNNQLDTDIPTTTPSTSLVPQQIILKVPVDTRSKYKTFLGILNKSLDRVPPVNANSKTYRHSLQIELSESDSTL